MTLLKSRDSAYGPNPFLCCDVLWFQSRPEVLWILVWAQDDTRSEVFTKVVPEEVVFHIDTSKLLGDMCGNCRCEASTLSY